MVEETGQNEIRAFRDAFDALKKDSFGYEFIVREQLSKIMLFCYQKLEGQLYTPDNEKSADTVRITKMLEFIQAHYAESITLKAFRNLRIWEKENVCVVLSVRLESLRYNIF